MMSMKKRNPVAATAAIHAETFELGGQVTFLEVLSLACSRNARYTLTLEADGVAYTVLVDRGGPFNASGGGTVASASLVRAALVRAGRCSLVEGWPVAQPLYQPGLDTTLKALLNGVVEPADLPRPRGVESLRNAEFHEPVYPAAGGAEAFVRPAEVPSDTERVIASLPQPAAPTRPARPARPAAQDTATEAVVTAPPITFGPPREPASAGAAVSPPATGRARRLATRALLWMVEVEEGKDDYTLQQAAAMAGRGLVEGVGDLVHPLKHDLDNRIHSVKSEWKHSGEVAARNTRKRNSRRVTVVGDFDPDGEFRRR